METMDLGDFSHPSPNNTTADEDDILRYLLSDVPSSDSTPDNSPPHMFEDSTPDASPSHWSQELLTPPVVPQLSELALDLNPDVLLYGSNDVDVFDNSFMNVSLSGVPMTPPKEISNHPIIPLVPIVQPQSIQPIPIVQPPQHSQVPIVVNPPPKKNKVAGKKRPRTVDVPTVPSPQEKVSLPRDTLLNITSQSMERYVETLQTSRSLSNDDQKELKRQKRLIKNRESAQLSRERKRAYIDQLEARIAQLVANNDHLKTDNDSLREALSKYEGVKSEPTHDLITSKVAAASQHQLKMGNLFSVGQRSTATAGVCLLIVLFSFGLFLNNVNKPTSGPNFMARLPLPAVQQPSSLDMNVFDSRVMTPVEVGYRRGLLEAFPEVSDEENDTESFEPSAKFSKALPLPDSSSPKSVNPPATSTRHVIRLAGASSTPLNKSNQHKIEINKAGVFTVSYSPSPTEFSGTEHSHDGGANSTFMLFLDPRPDLEDDSDVENASAPVSSTHETQLEVATPMVKKEFPPMIISLVIPEELANGSNPLLLPEGLNPSNSLMEITCQVVDISITTSEQPPKN